MEEKFIPANSFMSAEINEISEALSQFQGSIEQPKLEKEVKVTMKSGGKYSFKYADLSACVKSAAPALKENGLSVTQIINEGKLITLLSHKSGQWIKSELYLPQQTNDYQSYGSAITYLKRYSYCAILGIVADTDDDANMACGNEDTVKDHGTRTNGGLVFTGAQLQQAIAEMNAVTDEHGLQQVWEKWGKNCPAICGNTTEFYKVALAKRQTFRQPVGK
ncbi:MAG: ERF family protein [Muribaculaceae bacterium]|nr:ERF family protein [Muribaculaceae bacterium]MDE7465509.1 ERF family protein [Muribaculaceae bacterium]